MPILFPGRHCNAATQQRHVLINFGSGPPSDCQHPFEMVMAPETYMPTLFPRRKACWGPLYCTSGRVGLTEPLSAEEDASDFDCKSLHVRSL